MQLNDVKAFIFDLDGTLIDTEKIYRIIWPKAVSDLGFTYTDEQFLSMRSLGRPYSPLRFKELFGEEFDYDEARRIRKKYFDQYIEEHGIELKGGAIELLCFLRNKGITTAIATATDLDRAMEYLDMTGLSGYFDKVISATMVDEGKPSPKVYLHACKELGLEPRVCVAVEDAPNGIKSANAAGLNVIMVPDLTEPDDELCKLISRKANSLDEIISWFND
ncbi:MAG: HAD family phosphatase [Lachnospiraceae bacterium]|nr:HAD family phosphatase [Lachnospiraceae bacterium]